MIQSHGDSYFGIFRNGVGGSVKKETVQGDAKARVRVIQPFAGISDPHETPKDADVTLDTKDLTPDEVAQEIFLHLQREGFIAANGSDAGA
jgi:adenylylsulfate kinase-like enzyme